MLAQRDRHTRATVLSHDEIVSHEENGMTLLILSKTLDISDVPIVAETARHKVRKVTVRRAASHKTTCDRHSSVDIRNLVDVRHGKILLRRTGSRCWSEARINCGY